MGELTVVTGRTGQASVVELARELRVHVETFVALCTAFHLVEFAQFEFHWEHHLVGVGTVITLKTNDIGGNLISIYFIQKYFVFYTEKEFLLLVSSSTPLVSLQKLLRGLEFKTKSRIL